jgi:tetratricopeptide (TPR) repeat protein
VDEPSRWLWDEDHQRRSKGALQTYIFRVRKALGDAGSVRTERGRYLIKFDEATLDLTRFRMLAAHGKAAAARGQLRHSADLLAEALAQWRHHILISPDDPNTGVDFTCHQDALDWFDEEAGNLVAAVRFAFREGRHKQCWQLAWLLQSFFIIRARLDEWRSVFDVALRAARLSGNRPGEAGILSGLGVAHGIAPMHDDSLRYLQEVLELQRELGAREGEARTQYNLALAAGKSGEHERAYGHAIEALRLVRELHLTNLEPDVMQAVGDISSSMGRHEVALELADDVLAIWRRRGVVDDERFALRSRVPR